MAHVCMLAAYGQMAFGPVPGTPYPSAGWATENGIIRVEDGTLTVQGDSRAYLVHDYRAFPHAPRYPRVVRAALQSPRVPRAPTRCVADVPAAHAPRRRRVRLVDAQVPAG